MTIVGGGSNNDFCGNIARKTINSDEYIVFVFVGRAKGAPKIEFKDLVRVSGGFGLRNFKFLPVYEQVLQPDDRVWI